MRLVLSCLPSMGGSAITAVGLAHALAERGHEVHVVAADEPFAAAPGSWPDEDSPAFGHRADVTFHWPAPSTAAGHAVLTDDTTAWLRTAELTGVVAHDVRADVVNPHYLGGLLPTAMLAVAGLYPSAAVVASAHGTDVTDVPSGTERLLAALLATADGVTAVSEHLARLLTSRLGVPPASVRVIPNWVDAPPALSERSRRLIAGARRPGETLLVHASNFRPVKRATRCVDALCAALTRTPARLLLIGDGPERPAVLARAAALGVLDRVTVAGVQCPQQAFALLAAADVVLLPSESEACSGVLLQALAAGVPAVAYDVGGNSGVLESGPTGVLVPDERTSTGFSRAVADLSADAAARGRLARAGRTAASRFSRESTVTDYEDVFAQAAALRTRRLLAS